VGISNFIRNKIIKSEFFVAFSTSFFASIIQMAVGVVIVKILAITIGPTGVALMGQFTNFKDVISTIANGSFGQGVTKYIADQEVENKKVLATSNIFTLFFSVTISIIVVSFSNSLSILLFGTNEYYYVLIIFACTLPFFAFNNLLLATINGYRDYKILIKVKITNSLIALLVSGLLAWYFLIQGALIAQAINTSVIFFVSILIIYKVRGNYFSFDFTKYDKKVLKSLLAFTLMAITSTLLKPLVQIFLRSYIIANSSDYIAGIWEGVQRLSSYYTQIITMGMGVYYLPRLSSLDKNEELRKELLFGMKIILPATVLLALFILAFKDLIILRLFSEEFNMMSDLLPAQLIGDILMIFSFMIGYLLLAKAMTKEFIIIQVSLKILRIAAGIMLFNELGVIGLIYANIIVYATNLIILVILFRKIVFKINI